MSISYDVEADWVLLRTCNFRCSYCAIPLAELQGKIDVHATPSEWLEGFNATGKSWLLHITGGEPSIYPDFVNLCEQLASDHYLSINTNLSHECMDDFCERVDPARVHYINAALHCDERLKKHSLDAFIERVSRFAARGFNMLVSSVMTPAMTDAISELQTHFEARDLFIIPKAMRGWYEGRLYPDSYTDDERTLIRDHLSEARQRYTSVVARMGQAPTINMLTDERFLNRIRNYRGMLCASGVKFVQIEPNGGVLRCGSGQRLGNILMKDVRLLDAPKRCDTSYCPYFCEKYTSPPFVPPQDTFVASFVNSMFALKERVLPS